MKMADEVESGRSPYDYSAEIEKAYREGARKSRKGSPLVNIAAVAAFFLIFAAAFMGWKMFNDMSSEMDKMGVNIRELTEQLSAQRERGMKTGAAVTRSELKKTLVTLDSVMALGDEELSEKASKLRDAVLSILSGAGDVKEDTRPESSSAPAKDTAEKMSEASSEPLPGETGAGEAESPLQTAPENVEPDAANPAPQEKVEPQSGDVEAGKSDPQASPDLPKPVSPFDMEVEPLPGESAPKDTASESSL